MKRNAIRLFIVFCLIWCLVVFLAPTLAFGEGAPPGLTGGVLDSSTVSFLGEATGSQAGYSVAGAGDVNGDGYDDLLIGAPFYSDSLGRAYLFLGSPAGWQLDEWLDRADAIYTGETTGDRAGNAVAGAGDVNGDGYDDLLIGASYYGSNTGRAYLVLGSPSPASTGLGGAAANFTGENPGDYFAGSLAGAGDVNGDGYSDLLIGARGLGSGSGRAYLVLGSDSPTSIGPGGVDAIYTAENIGDGVGSSLAGAGDVNGDGYGDLLIGASNYSSGTGRAYLVLGSGSPTSMGLGGANAIYTGENNYDYSGTALAGAGDVNSDGYGDLFISASAASGLAGRTYLVLGGRSPASMGLGGADAIYTGENPNDGSGSSLAGGGDVNGDGYSDLLIGASNYGTSAGRTYLVLGSPSPTSAGLGAADAIYTGEFVLYHSASGLAGAGDVNGDGYSDLLIGASGAGGNRGKAYLILSDYDSAAAARYRAIQTTTTAAVEVGESDVWVDYNDADTQPGSVYVTRHYYNTCSTDLATNGLLWTVESQRGEGAQALFAFKYNDSQIAGWTEGDLKLYYRERPCQEWTQDSGANLNVSTNYLESSLVTDAHREYTIAPATPSPTALEVTSFGATLAHEPTWAVIGLALLIILATMAEWWSRRLRRSLP